MHVRSLELVTLVVGAVVEVVGEEGVGGRQRNLQQMDNSIITVNTASSYRAPGGIIMIIILKKLSLCKTAHSYRSNFL